MNQQENEPQNQFFVWVVKHVKSMFFFFLKIATLNAFIFVYNDNTHSQSLRRHAACSSLLFSRDCSWLHFSSKSGETRWVSLALSIIQHSSLLISVSSPSIVTATHKGFTYQRLIITNVIPKKHRFSHDAEKKWTMQSPNISKTYTWGS